MPALAAQALPQVEEVSVNCAAFDHAHSEAGAFRAAAAELKLEDGTDVPAIRVAVCGRQECAPLSKRSRRWARHGADPS